VAALSEATADFSRKVVDAIREFDGKKK